MTANDELRTAELLWPPRSPLAEETIGPAGAGGPGGPGEPRPPGAPGRAAGQARALVRRLVTALGPTGWPVAIYLASRIFLLALAGLVAVVAHRGFMSEFLLFDGQWYLRLAAHGYPVHALPVKSTLGFFPLYPLTIRALSWGAGVSLGLASLAISFAGGLAATVLVQRLATAWWGEATGSRAALLFTLFPGSVVFSMAYSECLTLPLAAGCLLALRSRRWWVAGTLAALASAVEPIAAILIVVCLAAAGRELRARGWRDGAARRSLAAPLLAPLGIGGFAVFLWAWTGTPFATYIAQHYGWHEQNQPLALLALPVAKHVLARSATLLPHVFSWNIWNGVLGAAFLLASVGMLLRVRRELSPGTLVLTIGTAAVTLWAVMTPPNPRMILIAFPAIIVWARRLNGRALTLFAGAEVVFFVAGSALTLSGHMLP